jgi:hypothetical protein
MLCNANCGFYRSSIWLLMSLRVHRSTTSWIHLGEARRFRRHQSLPKVGLNTIWQPRRANLASATVATKARDPDIVTTSTVLSLKCPLSTLRIDLPCRSILCRHNQCFDGTSYLQLQEQGPTWQCPICNNSAPFENLAVDEYVSRISKS